jgi:hypothetical protein
MRGLICLGLLGLVPAAFAQTIPPTLDACATESDSGKRLACFDREIARLHQLQRVGVATPGSQGPGAPHGASAGAAPSSPAGSANTPVAGVPIPAAPRNGAATAPDPNDTTAVDRFGLTPEMQHQREAAGKAPAPLQQIAAHVASVRYLPRGEIVVGLDNGQTWQQAEYDGDVTMDVGEPVTIKAGALTAYYLKPRAGRIIRVRRLK